MRSFGSLAAPLLAASALTVACTDRPILDSYTSATEGTDGTTLATATGATSGPSTSGPSTTSPTSTTGPSTSGPSTSGPVTSGPNTTSNPTTDPTGVPDFGNGYCGDFWCSEVEDCDSCPSDCFCSLPPGLVGCPLYATNSWVTGATPFGDFNGYYAFFAWDGSGDTSWSALNVFIFDASVDLQDAVNWGPYSYHHYALRVFTDRNYPEWVSQNEHFAILTRDDKGVDAQVLLSVDGKLGAWDFVDPGDPPRLYGQIFDVGLSEVVVEGYFEAVFCDALTSWIIPE